MSSNPLSTGLKIVTLAAVLATGTVSTAPAEAHPRARVNVWLGGPLWWPGYWGPYPYVVERPVVVQAPAEPLVVQPSAAQQAQVWYYCRDAQMYYPYVSSCASPWQEVPATPAPAAPTAPAASPAPAPHAATPSSGAVPPAPAAPATGRTGTPVPAAKN
jgi:hypothetical protein